MTIASLPVLRRTPIEDPDDIAALEAAITALCGVVAARGGFTALVGRDLLAIPPAERARVLTAMYDAGEVVIGWRDGVSGEVLNAVIERLAGQETVGYRIELYVEGADGHVLRGALAERDAAALGTALAGAAQDGGAGALSPGAALATLARGA